MGARSGNNYLSAMRKLKSEVWIGGERVADPTTHPALKPVTHSLASLYDMQIEHPAAVLGPSPHHRAALAHFVAALRLDEGEAGALEQFAAGGGAAGENQAEWRLSCRGLRRASQPGSLAARWARPHTGVRAASAGFPRLP